MSAKEKAAPTGECGSRPNRFLEKNLSNDTFRPSPKQWLNAAIAKYGPPNPRLSHGNQLRFGRRGSIAVDLEAGIFFDHESGEGGVLAGLSRCLTPYRARQRDSNENRRAQQARELWEKTATLSGTPAERYLKMRGVIDLAPSDLRFHPHCPHGKETAPAMVAVIRDIHNNGLIGVHRTFLRQDGSGRDGQKMILGRARGGCVKLSADGDVTFGLGLVEGIETGLSLISIGWRPIWAAISAGGVAKFPVLPGIESLTLFADHDDAGLKAAKKCAIRWRDAGRDAKIITPRASGKDWNDVQVA